MKKALPITLVLIGAALLITAVVFWIDSSTSTEPQSFGKTLLDWVTLIAGLGASIKGWMDLVKKETSSQPIQSNQDGGVIVSGSVGSVGKDVIGRDQVITTNIVSEDNAYNVEGLPNPYLGLQAFTYNEHDKYAGREKLVEEALQLLVSPGEERNFLFVTGASGSGKSSFVQAGLLPALINYYRQNGETIKFEVFRPSRNPKTRLDEALKRLRSRNVQVIVVDQFEELFTQSASVERDALLDFLRKLESFKMKRRFVIATLRSDYLGEMFDVQWLWAIAKQGIELRGMKFQELKDAILRPLQSKFPNGNKRFDSKLVEKLAGDAAESVTYLPLLQVTLEELWNKGQLKLGSYNLLTDAIKERADAILVYRDFDKATPYVKRPDSEREEILNILLSLVNPSPDNDARHDVRVSRVLSEFNDKQMLLLRELSKARLTSIEVESGVEIVNLIHETLIRNWDILRNRISEKRLQLQKRARFETQFELWISSNRSEDYLLSKGQVADAHELEQSGDIALGSVNAQEFLQISTRKLTVEQERGRVEAEISNARRNAAQIFGRMAFATAGSVHALRNHLGMIKGNLQLVSMLNGMDNDTREGFIKNQIPKTLERLQEMGKLVDSLHEPLRPINDTLVDVNNCLRRAFDWIIQVDQSWVELGLSNSPLVILTTREMLTEAFKVLIKNANEAMISKEKKSLLVTSRMHGNEIEVVIKDNGVGISPENLEKIFEMRFAKEASGIHFGLFWTKDYIEGLGGKISVSSVLGEGTTFTITLPPTKTQEGDS